MNKTFKVIFSRARGAFVAVNEAAKTTSRASVKTAVAAALLAVSVGASATAVKGVVWNSAEAPELTADAIEMTGQEVVNSIQKADDNYYAYLNVQAGASGVLNDVSINLKASGPVDTNKADKQIFGIEQTGGKVTLGGSILNIAVETDLIGGGNNQATALEVYNPKSREIVFIKTPLI